MSIRARSWLALATGLLAVSAILSVSSCRRKQAAREDLAILPKNAQAIVAVNATRMRDTAMWRKLLSLRDETPEAKKQYEDMVKRCDFDPFKQLDSAIMAVPSGMGDGELGIIVHGTFNEAKLVACVKEELEKQGQKLFTMDYDGKKLYSDAEGGGKVSVALLDPRTAIIGGKDWAKKMLDLATGKVKGESVQDNAELVGLVKKTKTSDAIWAVALVPDSIRQKLQEAPALASAKSLKHVYGSLDFATGIRLDAVLDLGAEADAKELMSKVNEQISEIKKNPQVMMLGLSTMIDAIKTSTEGPSFKLAVSYNQQQVDQLIERVQGLLKTATGGQ